ncbi:MAG: ABC transporter ATP-binding protein [Myxococcota bacterium]|jgi:oligopeptide/dipeptide ABC transporter ATP-binding protein
MDHPLLEISDLTVALRRDGGEVFPVRGLRLRVERSETLCLVGESGSGKSLTALAVMGLLPPVCRVAAGSIRLDGTELIPLPQDTMRSIRGRRMAMVFQEPMTALNPLFTVGNQVAEAMTAHGVKAKVAAARAIDLLSETGVHDPARVAASFPHQLSGGLRQRAVIAMALANSPSLLLADEPTTALDVTVAAKILALMVNLKKSRGMGVLLITHDFGVVAAVADRVAVMYAGQVVEAGDKAAILEAPRHPYTRALIDALPGRAGIARGSMLKSIPGTVPDLSLVGAGCRFAPRCRFAAPECVAAEPPPVEAAGRMYRCIRPL